MPSATGWSYSSEIEEDRQKDLLNAPPFEEIVNLIEDKMEILCGDVERSTELERKYFRYVYCIKVKPSLFDLFFNSVTGYRASYFLSPAEGIEKNRSIINRLLPKLLASNFLAEIDKSKISNSFSQSSAKVWLAEKGKHLCQQCIGEWSPPTDDKAEILNGRWEIQTKELAGRKAPRFTKIRVFGGFIDDFGSFKETKPGRANDIHDFGWS